jgi:rubrerythrin
VLETWKTIISEASQKGKFNGIAVMGMPEPFFETINHQKLVEYEELVSREFDGSFEAVCCYMQRSVADLPLKYLISLLNSHQYIVTGVEEHSQWYHAKVLEMIGRGLEKTVGKKTSKLAFEAMKSMYKIDERTVIAQPAVFENALRKMFADSAETVLHAIKDEIMRDILFESHPNDINQVPVHFLICPSCHWSATTIVNWKPEFCPVCHHSAIRSVPVNYRE